MSTKQIKQIFIDTNTEDRLVVLISKINSLLEVLIKSELGLSPYLSLTIHGYAYTISDLVKELEKEILGWSYLNIKLQRKV